MVLSRLKRFFIRITVGLLIYSVILLTLPVFITIAVVQLSIWWIKLSHQLVEAWLTICDEDNYD